MCSLLCSCEKFDARSSDDYIGLGRSEPNAVSAAVPEANAVSPSVSESNEISSTSGQQVSASGPLSISLTQATLLALENNKSLVIERFNPQIQRTFEQEQLSIFDLDFTANVSQERTRAQSVPRPGLGSFSSLTKTFSADAGIQQFLPSGTTLSLDGATDILDGSFLKNPFVTSSLGFSVTQALLRGFGTKVNLASVNQAKIDTKASQYELRGFVEVLVAQIEETYWDFVLAERQISIVIQSLELAQKQLEQAKERINVGKLAQSELAAAEAEVALRREDLIDARSTLAKTKLKLLRLVNPPGSNLWDRAVILTSYPVSPPIQLDDVEPHVALALQMRPDLNQAKLQMQRDELEIIKTKNGMLPRMDLFITLGKTGYADSFGESVGNIHNNYYDVLGGVSFEYPFANRAAQARNLRAVVTQNQDREAINNLTQLVEVDVRTAYLEIIRTQEQVAATTSTRKLQEEKLRAETEKFQVGKSTSLLVAQAQRDLLSSQISEIEAVVNYTKSFVELYRLEGSLLERRGIASPGRESIKLSDTAVQHK